MDESLWNELIQAAFRFDPDRLWKSGIAVLLMIAVLIAMRVAFKAFKKRSHIGSDVKKYHFFLTAYRIMKVFVIITAVMGILSINGVNVTSFSMLFGVFAAMIVFAVKDSFQDIFAGFTIMLDKYFSVGDAVEYEGKDGVVVSFTIRTTKIEFLDDRSVMSISNRHITKIKKLTHLVDIDIPLSYELDRKTAFSVLSSVCEKIKAISGIEDCQFKGTQSFSEYAVIYKLRFFCEPNDRPDIRREVMKTIQDGLNEAEIRIPYRQIEIRTYDQGHIQQ